MKKMFLCLALLASNFGSATLTLAQSDVVKIESSQNNDFSYPAEWEEHDAIWLSWPTYENLKGKPSYTVHLEIIKALDGHVAAHVLVQDAKEADYVRTLLQKKKISSKHVKFFHVPHNDVWIRDMGPLFVKNSNGKLKVVDFNFNTWGYESQSSENSRAEEAIDRAVANTLNLPTLKSQIVSEGGGLEFNGRGTLITTESVALQRNPGLKLADVEAEYKRLFNLTKVIWLKQGLYEDDHTFRGRLPGNVYTVITTGGHIDEFARWVDPTTVLLAEASEQERNHDPIAKVSGERMDENYKILQNSTDQAGNKINIIRMPMPDPIFVTLKPGDGTYDYIKKLKYEDGSKFPQGKPVKAILAASYLNYVVTNGLVIAPKYYQPGRPQSTKVKDAEAKKILESAFKGRKVVQINPEIVNAGGGGMHCITQQQPISQ